MAALVVLMSVAGPLPAQDASPPAPPQPARPGPAGPAPVAPPAASQPPAQSQPAQPQPGDPPGAAPAQPAPASGQPAPAEPAPAQPAPAQPPPAGPFAVDRAALPHDLSPWGMFRQADIVVKAVMIGLVVASLLTWTIWLAKGLELAGARRKARSATRKLQRADSMSEAIRAVESGWTRRGPVAELVHAATAEVMRSSHGVTEGTKERVAIALSRIEARIGREAARGTGVLATIGATAPFVGLFGTVWGIMNAFIGISKAKTTNLAVVAPGIAEALLATALGLVAAIPAVIIYNAFARTIAGYRALLSDASGEILQHLSRDAERAEHDAAPHASRPPRLTATRQAGE